MALKRPHTTMETFSMASLTDIIFLLLVFFMVTSTYVFPTALEVNLPEGTEQTPMKPTTRVFVDVNGEYYVSFDDKDLRHVSHDSLVICLTDTMMVPADEGIAVYADSAVAYGKVVEVLNLGAANSLKMVLATRPSQNAVVEAVAESEITTNPVVTE